MSGPSPAVRLRYYWLSLLKWVVYICWLHFFTTHSETPCNLASATASLLKLLPCRLPATDFLLNSSGLIFLSHPWTSLFAWLVTLHISVSLLPVWTFLLSFFDGRFSSSSQMWLFSKGRSLVLSSLHSLAWFPLNHLHVINSAGLTPYPCPSPVFLMDWWSLKWSCGVRHCAMYLMYIISNSYNTLQGRES